VIFFVANFVNLVSDNANIVVRSDFQISYSAVQWFEF
jgi:hypothetical protein